MRGLSIRLFETGLGILILNDLNGFKNTTNVYSIHLELRMALPCQTAPDNENMSNYV